MAPLQRARMAQFQSAVNNQAAFLAKALFESLQGGGGRDGIVSVRTEEGIGVPRPRSVATSKLARTGSGTGSRPVLAGRKYYDK